MKYLLLFLLAAGSLQAATYPTASTSAVMTTGSGQIIAQDTTFTGALRTTTLSFLDSDDSFPMDVYRDNAGLNFYYADGGGIGVTLGRGPLGTSTFYGQLVANQSLTVSGALTVDGDLQAVSPTTTYLLVTFNNSNSTYPVLYSSIDGKAFNPTSITPPFTTTNLRDPQIIKLIVNGVGWYYLSYTTSYPASTNYLGLKKSRDLVNWVDVATPNWSSLWTGSENMIWNGSWYVENGIVYLLFCTASSSQRPYVVSLDPVSDAFSNPVPITGDADFTAQKADFTSVWKVGGTYHALIQNNGNRGGLWVEHATSSSLLTGWSIVQKSNWAGWGEAESGAMVALPSGKYRAYFCGASTGVYQIYYSDSSSADLTTATWSAPVLIANQPFPQDWVGVVAYSDLQTEQVLSATQREVLGNKVGAAGNNAFTGANTFSGATSLATVSATALLATNATVSGTLTVSTLTGAKTITGTTTVSGPSNFTATVSMPGTNLGGLYFNNGLMMLSDGSANQDHEAIIGLNNSQSGDDYGLMIACSGNPSGAGAPGRKVYFGYATSLTSYAISGYFEAQSKKFLGYGDFVIATAGKGLQIKSGSNAKIGTATLSSGTVTVSNTSVTSNSQIHLTTQTPSGTVGAPYVSARTVGTSFTVSSTSSGDNSVVGWEIVELIP